MYVVNEGVLKLCVIVICINDSYVGYEFVMICSKVNFKLDSSNSYFIVVCVKLLNVVGIWFVFWINLDLDVNGNGVWFFEIDIFEGVLNGVEDIVIMLY